MDQFSLFPTVEGSTQTAIKITTSPEILRCPTTLRKVRGQLYSFTIQII